ncbi:MAG: hypothetical protein GXP09_00965 [Gammaproteobacteria bacterium]|nr:hypothetical protein [Gammaproteobacteria bacterium]
MKLNSIEQIFQALNSADVQYLVAGGLAVNAHGYLRFTSDVDLVVALEPDNIIKAFKALRTLDYKPLVPITAEQFANPNMRQQWIDEKGMKVLNFFSDQHRETGLDIFVYAPFDFETEYSAAMRGELLPGLYARFVSIPALICMKETANRPRDVDDIRHLRWILEDQNSHE